jgi:hypothetical protein
MPEPPSYTNAPLVARRSPSSLCSSVAFAASVLGSALPARAEEPIALRYEAADACPSRADFEAEVAQRTPRAHFVDVERTGAARSFRVTLRVSGSGAVGRLETHAGADRADAERTLTGKRCADVASGLALVAALSIDPQASTSPNAASAGASAPAQELALAAPEGSAPSPGGASSPEAAPSLRPAPSSGPDAPPSAVRSSAIRLAASGAGLAAFGLAPEPLAGARIAASIERDARGTWAPPSLAVGGAFLSSAPFSGGSAFAELAYFTGEAEACPVGFRPTAALTLRPCGAAAAGAVTGRGLAVAHPESDSRLWVDARALGRITLSWSAFDLELRGGALVPITQPTFVFRAPHVLVHETPWVAAFVGIGAGAHF